jgi:hypothetical protein
LDSVAQTVGDSIMIYQVYLSSQGGKPFAFYELDTIEKATAKAKLYPKLVTSIVRVPIDDSDCETYEESYGQHRTHPY